MNPSFIRNTFLLLFLTLLLSTNLSAQKTDFPPYKDIVVHLYSTYNTDGFKFSFFKDKKGYSVIQTKEKDTIKVSLLWSKKRKKYLPLKLDLIDPFYKLTTDEIIDQKVSDHHVHYFDLFESYQYYGWKEDELSMLLKKKHLSDDDLYALGKIYTLKSQEVIHQNQNYPDPSYIKLPEEGRDLISSEHLKLYLKYGYLCIKYHKQLHERNPFYGTFIGSIKNKYEDEYVSMYRELSTYQNEEEAKKVLIDSLYDEYMINYAKNVLGSCSKGSVLFTHGDNDTHPLLYVQVQYGFRDDVRVLNSSLLNTQNYINQITDYKYLNAPPLKLSINRHRFSEDSLGYVFSNRDVTKYKGILSYDDVTKLWNLDSLHNPKRENTFTIPDQNLRLRYKEGDSITFRPKKKKPMYRSELIMLDLINSNNIDFYTTSNQTTNTLHDYFKPIGLVSKYSKEEQPELYENNILNTYNYSYKNASDVRKTKHPNFQTRSVRSLRYHFGHLATKQYEEGQKIKAHETIDKYFVSFPLKDFPLTPDDLYWVYRLQRIKQINLAEKCLNNILDANKTEEFYDTLRMYNTNYKTLLNYISNDLKSYKLEQRFKKAIEEACTK